MLVACCAAAAADLPCRPLLTLTWPPPTLTPPAHQAVCELLSTAGAKLEGSPKGKARLDAAFRQLERLSNASKVGTGGRADASLWVQAW